MRATQFFKICITSLKAGGKEKSVLQSGERQHLNPQLNSAGKSFPVTKTANDQWLLQPLISHQIIITNKHKNKQTNKIRVVPDTAAAPVMTGIAHYLVFDSWVLQCTLQLRHFHSTFSPDVIWTVMENEWLIRRQMFDALYLLDLICRSTQSAGWPVRGDSGLRRKRILNRIRSTSCGPGPTWC